MPKNPKLSDSDNMALVNRGLDPMRAEVVKNFEDRWGGEISLRESMDSLGFPEMHISEFEHVIDLAKSLTPGTIFTVSTAAYGNVSLMTTPFRTLTRPQPYIVALEATVIKQREIIDSQLKALTFKALFALMFNKLTILFRKGPSNGK